MIKEIRHCEKHGDTEFAFYEKLNRWRCLKCQTEATAKRRKKVKEMALLYKGNKCLICRYDRCQGALEFHHLDSSLKDFGISERGYTRSWDKIMKELDKCILVCANCHREIHAGIVSVNAANPSVNLLPEVDDPPSSESSSIENTSKRREIPSKEQLISDFKDLSSFTAVGRKYNVSDNAVRKWMKKYLLPTHTKELKEYIQSASLA